MEIINQIDTNFKEWVEFIQDEKSLNCWGYTRNFQSQCGIWIRIEDLSFAVVEDNKVVAICPLYLSEKDGYRDFSDDGGYLRGPIVSSALTERQKNKIMDVIVEYIDSKAAEKKVETVMFFFDPQPGAKSHANPLMEYGYLDASMNTQLLDLSLSEEDLRLDLRKSYKALVNKGLKTYEIHAMDSTNYDYEVHEIYRDTHRRAAGRETRPKKYFDLQFEEMKAGEATLIYMKYQGKFVQLDYFNHRNGYVYYSSAADDPEFSASCEVPMGHSILWFAKDHFKAKGMKWLEVGWQFYDNQLFAPASDKERAISYFKRGFGGYTYSLYRGVKFYNDNARKRYFDTMESEWITGYESCSKTGE